MMRIGIAFPGCHRRGGVERVTFECARFLAGRGHEVSLLCSEWDEVPHPAVRMVRVPEAPVPAFLKSWIYFRRSTKALGKLNYEVLTTHGCVCPLDGVQWVQSVHGAWLEQAARIRRRGSRGWWKQRLNPFHPVVLWLERKHFRSRRYRHVITTTSQVRADLFRLYGVPEKDVTILPNGFSPEEFNPERRWSRRAEARLELRLAEEDVAFLFAVNELDRKGYAVLLAALTRLASKPIKIVMAGRYDRTDAIKRARYAGVADRILFRGPTSDIARYHAACDVFILPTQYEAFSLAILEALGSGVPVITSGIPGARDALRDDLNGILVEDPMDSHGFLEAMTTMLDPELRGRLSKSAPGSVVEHQWSSILSRYEGILHDYAKITPSTMNERSRVKLR